MFAGARLGNVLFLFQMLIYGYETFIWIYVWDVYLLPIVMLKHASEKTWYFLFLLFINSLKKFQGGLKHTNIVMGWFLARHFRNTCINLKINLIHTHKRKLFFTNIALCEQIPSRLIVGRHVIKKCVFNVFLQLPEKSLHDMIKLCISKFIISCYFKAWKNWFTRISTEYNNLRT